MKRLIHLTPTTAAGLLVLSASLAGAQFSGTAFQVTINLPGYNPVTITDGQPGGPNQFPDTDPAKDRIGFDVTFLATDGQGNIIQGKTIEVKGHAFQSLGNTTRPDVGLAGPNALVITSTGGLAVANATVTVQSATIGTTPTAVLLKLKGKYTLKGGLIQAAGIAVDGFALRPGNVLLQTGSLPRAGESVSIANKSSVQFSYPDISTKVGVPVTQLADRISFSLGPDDAIVLPGSTDVLSYTADRIITVTTNQDLADLNPGAGCAGCSLRQALVEADLQSGTSAIQFNIPSAGVPVILMSTNVTHDFGSMGAVHTVIVDGASQPGGLVEIDGIMASPQDAAANPIVGLELTGANSMVVGLDIHSFPSHGIQIRPTGAPVNGSNDVEDNLIGTDPTGTKALPNGGDGLHISQQPSNTIASNVIAFNKGNGITVDGSGATGNLLHENLEVGNAGGILLSNGGNNLQPAPTLTSASSDGFTVTVAGTVHSTGNASVSVEVFANPTCDPSGQGQDFLGSTLTTTDGSGNAIFSGAFVEALPSGEVVTATVTDPNGNTSQFSACKSITQTPPANQPPIANAGPNQTVNVGTLVTLNGTGSSDPDNGPSPLTYSWKQTSGPIVVLSGAMTATPSFTPQQPGTYVFSLVVNDGLATSAPSSVTITVVTPSAAAQIQALILEVGSVRMPQVIRAVLLLDLNQASDLVEDGHNRAAINAMQAFIFFVRVGENLGISSKDGAALIAAANGIIVSL